MSTAYELLHNWRNLLVPLGVLLATLAVSSFAKSLLFRVWRRRAAATKTRVDDILIQALDGPVMIWALILGLDLAAQVSPLPQRVADVTGRILLVLWIASVTVVASRLAASFIRHYGRHVHAVLPVTSLTENLARLAVVITGILVVLNILGVSITPILTALGVGGLAVALALQDTLSNLFAGFYVTLAGQIRVGDYIKLDGGQEGYVTDVSWRSTAIRALPNNMIIVPNAKLAQAIVTNYHLPEKRMSLLIPIGVSYDSDPEQVERLLIEETKRAAPEIPGLLAEPEPFVRFMPGFGESSLDFTLICQVKEFVDQYLVQHELRKRILRRFRQAGVEFPVHNVCCHDHALTERSSAPQTVGRASR